MKILLISTFGPNIRGISPYADSLADALGNSKEIKLTKLDYKHPFPSGILPINTRYDADNSFALIDYRNPSTWKLPNIDFDVVHIQYWSPAFLPVIIAMIRNIKKSQIKIITTWHNPKPHEAIPLIKKFENYLLNSSNGIITHTIIGETIIMNRNSKIPSKVIHHGCDLKDLKFATKSDFDICNLSESYKYILFFGNIRPYKGLDILIDAWISIKDKHPQYKLIIAGRLWEKSDNYLSKFTNFFIGTSKYGQLIKSKIDKLDDTVISDLNFISEEKAEAYLTIADYAIFPYKSFESQSGAATRAASHGVPIITTDSGGLSELAISNKYICKNNNIDSLAHTIDSRLNNFHPKLKSIQKSISENYSWGNSADEHIAFYKEISAS